MDGQEIIIYVSEDGLTKIDVKLSNEMIWLTQLQLAELYQTTKQNVSKHIKHIFDDGELDKKSVVNKKLTTAADGKDYNTDHYNLDMIISLGYRINSKIATGFRQWATERLSEYIRQGFTMNDEFLKNNGGGAYWKKLLARIRDIRSSEKALYRQVLDLYATAVDYDPKALESIKFFKIVQNKLHYATHQQTASEVIYNRADSKEEFMGLTVFAGDLPVLEEVRIAKNYLSADELDTLNRLVSMFFEGAELKAKNHQPTYMKDWIKELDKIMSEYGKGVLLDAGKISHEQAMEKAEDEYRKYQAQTLSPAEKSYLESIKVLQKRVEAGNKVAKSTKRAK
ncbi:toxin Fic [Alphaproteobacteria bacterium]|nr:toxin Fic [Alphaproteobacteria bacterium]